uniref:Hexosyltransferase n=1 Tax=Phallusia mammillata TaxID=59560 RepID=A0A6F9D8T4_9ASCI|nr:chondroitin sulfate synthase 3-like [Phallusia mammillata]
MVRLNLRKIKFFPSRNNQKFQFLLSFAAGWFVFGQLWTQEISKAFDVAGFPWFEPRPIQQCVCQRFVDACLPCGNIRLDMETKMKNNLDISKSYYRSYRYKPLSSVEDETHRWRFLTSRHNYEITNQEPRIGLNGMWKREVDEVDKISKVFIRTHDSNTKKSTGPLSVTGMFRKSDPFHGFTYLVNLEEGGKADWRKHTTVEVWKSFVSGKPKLLDIELSTQTEMINIISPLSKVTERFNLFLQRYEQNVLGPHGTKSGAVRMIFVIFEPPEGEKVKKDDSVVYTVQVLDQFKARNPNALVEYIFTKGEFNRAIGIHTGVKQCKEDEIVLFLDVDLKIGPDFLNRVRRNTLMGKRVIFPIMYSQYDPDVMDESGRVVPSLQALTDNKLDINKQTGFWIYYAYGVAAMYKVDYLKVGGFRLDIRGWGGEDVDLFKKMVADPDLDVMSMVDPDLIHIYHKRGCDVNLASDQYAMCIGAWAETLGSKMEVASLYLDGKSHK